MIPILIAGKPNTIAEGQFLIHAHECQGAQVLVKIWTHKHSEGFTQCAELLDAQDVGQLCGGN